MEKAENLANELSRSINLIHEHLVLLLVGEQKQSFAFGRALAIKAENIHELIKEVMLMLSVTENPNLNFALGLLSGVYQKSADDWSCYLKIFSENPKLMVFYHEVILTGLIEQYQLNTLLNIIKNGQLSALSAINLKYGGVIKHLRESDISSFCLDLAKVDAGGHWVALDIMFMYCYGDDNKFYATKDALRILVTSVPLNAKFRGGHSDMYYWKEIISKISKTEGLDFAKEVCQQIIAATDDKLDYGDIWVLSNTKHKHYFFN
ncbi:hypothetical protein AADEFJLK_04707 [Methylovulum psychrotolerans]|uniref:Uncharacterized protein n=2 Tax=Methylovulum psychrotolerans TaxID=1704499 RepID=A0A2S5CFE9_9GAMM|nr:hypothetical protein AADEFJLK_04707 [Methylovulum psychrotolerans]